MVSLLEHLHLIVNALVEKTLDVEGSLISTDRPWCRICSKTWRSICSCSTCDSYQDLEGIISGYKKFISVLIPALKGCEASRWKANTDRSLTFCRHLASLIVKPDRPSCKIRSIFRRSTYRYSACTS